MALRDDEIETTIIPSKDGSELTINLKGEGKLQIEAVILELEYLINQFSKAEEELRKPGFAQH